MGQQTGEDFRVGRRKDCRQAPEHVGKRPAEHILGGMVA